MADLILGAIIAGGRSNRFGSEKAVAMLGGRTLVEHAAAKLQTVASRIAINAPAESEAATFAKRLGFPLAPDAPGDPQGPLAGVKAALSWASAEGAEFLATAPCDTPLLPADLYPRLRAEIGDSAAAIAETPDGPQALCGLWRVSALPSLAAALAGGQHPPVREALSALGMRRVRFEDSAAFANLNSPADLAALAARLG